MKQILNEDHPSTAYQCGRLMAVLAYVQYKALGNVGADVVQRYYAAACTTPQLVLGRIIKLSQFHLGKLEPQVRLGLSRRIADVMSRIEEFPKTLTTEQQSLFALGYYHQQAYRPDQNSTDDSREE